MKKIFLVSFASCIYSALFGGNINIQSLGAQGDGKSKSTKFIQKAIDLCTQAGGGTVVIPSGRFVSGTFYMKSHVTLFLEKGAVLLASTDSSDYPSNKVITVRSVRTHSRNGTSGKNLSLIYAENQDDIALAGEGCIDGNGDSPVYKKGDNAPNRPRLIYFISCRRVSVKDLFLTNSPYWLQEYTACDGLTIRGITVLNHSTWNVDGIDLDSKNVTVSDCLIDCDDDGICLKSYLPNKPCENISITNCVVATNCNAIKMGTPGYGGFRNISISNCTLRPSAYDNMRHWTKRYKHITAEHTMISGISITCADGGLTENINIHGITMKATQTPLFIKISNRQFKMADDTVKRISRLRNVIVSDIIGECHSLRTTSISAYPGTYVENVQLHHFIFNIFSTGTAEDRKVIPREREDGYPQTTMIGEIIPSFGFFIRHVKNISVSDVTLNLKQPDGRFTVAIDDAEHVNLHHITVVMPEGKYMEALPETFSIKSSKDVILNNEALTRQ